MLTLKKIRTVAIVNCIGITSILCIGGQCMATSIIPTLSYQGKQPVTSVENTLTAEEISQIEHIRNDFNHQLSASKKELARVQKIFNENLELDTDETVIRQTFPPVAKAMEDIVVQQIKMMQQVNKIISAHMVATSSASQALTQVASENAHELKVNKEQ